MAGLKVFSFLAVDDQKAKGELEFYIRSLGTQQDVIVGVCAGAADKEVRK